MFALKVRVRATIVRSLRVAAAAALLVAALAPASPAAAATSLVLTPSIGPPGTTVQAEAFGFLSGTVTFWWDNTLLLGSDPSGRVRRLTFTVPLDASPGLHVVRACSGSKCPPGTTYADATFTVPGSPTPTPTPIPTPKSTPTAAPSASEASPGPEQTIVPVGPVVGPTPDPTPLPVAVVTPAPQPPDGLAGPNAPFPNIVATGIEVTQGMQNLDNDMPLVAGRHTYARVYLHVEGADSWANVTGALEARRDGEQIGWIWPQNVWAVARIGGGERANLNDSLQFRLPASWLHGQIVLTAFVWSYSPDSPFTEESNADDNVTAEYVTFHEGDPLTIHLAPLHLHRNYHPSDIERVYQPSPQGQLFADGGDYGLTDRIVSGLYRYLPVATVNVDTIAGVVAPPGHLGGNEWNLGGKCTTTNVGLENGGLVVDDWTIFMEDTTGIQVGDKVTPDRPTLKVHDQVFDVVYFYARADGSGEAHGNPAGEGSFLPAGGPIWAYPCLYLTSPLHEPNETLGVHRIFYDWAEEREFFVGLIHPKLPTAFKGGIATSGTDSVSMRMTAGGPGTIAHEIAHQSGLGHVPCKDEDGDGVADEIDGGGLDPTHPMTLLFPNCRLAELDPRGWFGFDVYPERFGLSEPTAFTNDPAATAPVRVAFPLLSYVGPGWVDPYHYCRLLTYYGVVCSPDKLDLPWNPPNPGGGDGSPPFAAFPPESAAAPKPGVVLEVRITAPGHGLWAIDALGANDRSTARLTELLALESNLNPAGAGVLARLVVRDSSGATTWTAPIVDTNGEHGATGDRRLVMAVPIGPDDVEVTIVLDGDTVAARLSGSNAAPIITSLQHVEPDGSTSVATLTWIARDPDGDDVTATVLYAPDGVHWQVIEGGITGSSHKILGVDRLPTGPDERFRVVVFDGFRAASADVATDIPGSGLAPVLSLRGVPSRTTVFPLGATVILDASAFDREDRGLPGERIRWTSSLDGDLGTGPELRTRDLSSGKHVITAVTHDGHGNEGSASVEIIIDPAVVQPLPKPETEAAVDRIFAAIAAGTDPAPAKEPGTVKVQFSWDREGLALLVVLAVAIGAGLWLRLQRRRSRGGVRTKPLFAWSVPEPAESPPPEPPASLLTHEATHTHIGGSKTVTTHGDQTEGPPPPDESGGTLKGSKIKEN